MREGDRDVSPVPLSPPRSPAEGQAKGRARCLCVGGSCALLAAVALVWCGWEDVCLLPDGRCPESSDLVAEGGLVVIVCWPSRLSSEGQRDLRAVLASLLRAPSALTIVVDDLRSAFWGAMRPDVFCP